MSPDKCVDTASSNDNITVLLAVMSITLSLVRACAVSTLERVYGVSVLESSPRVSASGHISEVSLPMKPPL